MRERKLCAVRFAWFFLLAAAAVLLDQWTKGLALAHLKGQNAIPIWKNVFELSYVENRGAAFGMLQGKQGFFLVITAVVLAVILYVVYKMPSGRRFMPLTLCLAFISAGAVGNLIDRVLRGFVVDFFYFSLIDFPVFNVADVYVTVATAVLVILVLFYYEEDEFQFLERKGTRED